MATSNSTEVIQGIIKQLRLLPALESVPIGVANQIVPVMIAVEPRPKDIIARENQRTGSGTNTMFTTATDKDFYLTSVSAAVCNVGADLGEANCDSSLIQGTVNGTARVFLRAVAGFGATGTGNSGHNSLFFDPPIKLTANTAIQNVVLLAGTGEGSATFTGYEEETTW